MKGNGGEACREGKKGGGGEGRKECNGRG